MEENKIYLISNSQLQEVDQESLGRFYVKGRFENGQFFISGLIVGDAELATQGIPGWFELSAQKFYSQQTAQAPVSPYVVGYMTDQGFVPSRREIY